MSWVLEYVLYILPNIHMLNGTDNYPLGKTMDDITRAHLTNLWSADKNVQNDSFTAMLDATDQPVDWAYDVWDDMVQLLSHKDNHRRAISAQILCNLAKSDPEQRMLRD